jgi:hypothetical protein
MTAHGPRAVSLTPAVASNMLMPCSQHRSKVLALPVCTHLLNVAASGQQSCFEFGSSRVQISTARQAVMAEIFMVLHNSSRQSQEQHLRLGYDRFVPFLNNHRLSTA